MATQFLPHGDLPSSTFFDLGAARPEKAGGCLGADFAQAGAGGLIHHFFLHSIRATIQPTGTSARRCPMFKTLAFIGFLGILAAIGAGVYFFGGHYSVAGTADEPAIVKWAAHQGAPSFGRAPRDRQAAGVAR